MILKDLKQQMLIPREEYIINKRVNIQGVDVLLLGFTIEDDKNCLWTIHEQEEFISDRFNNEDEEEFKTNRDKLLYGIEARSFNKNLQIAEIEIQNNTISFGSASGGGIYDMNIGAMMRLQHFVEKGLISEEWDEIKLEKLYISQYEQREDEKPPVIDMSKDLDISLHIKCDSVEIPIQHYFKVEFGKQDVGTKIVYYDKQLGKENYFFIDEVYSFDVYEDIKEKFESIEDLEMRKEAISNIIEALEKIYPRDKNLAVIKYETIDDVQLNFNMKDYLDAKPIVHKSASSVGLILGSKDAKLGVNGYKIRGCILQPIDKDFKGELEIELFSRFVEIPEEIVQDL